MTTALIVSEEELAAWAIREAVDYGNIAPLFERVHSGKALPEECALAAEFHNGTRKRPPHRPAEGFARRQRALEMAADVCSRMRLGEYSEKVAVEDTAKAHGVSKQTVRNAVAEHSGLFKAIRRRARPTKS